MKTDLSRRSFLKGAGLAMAGAAGVATVGLAGCSSASASEEWMPSSWTDEADLIIVGYGGCGSTAAIAAAEAGATVVIVEKADYFGGNTCVSGGIYNAA